MTANSAAAGLNARQRVIVGKKKAAAAAMNAHRAEEAAIGEGDLEGDENYEDDDSKKKNKSLKTSSSKKAAKKQHISAKGTLLWSAEKVLREEKKPMKASEIIAKGREKGTQRFLSHQGMPGRRVSHIMVCLACVSLY